MRMQSMKRSETTEQIALFNWARANETLFPELKNMFHVPNEGKRTNGPVLRAAGLKEGVPDVFLLVPRKGFCGLAIEMKFGRNKTTASQDDWLKRLKKAGYKTDVCYGFEEAREIIRDYLQEPGKCPMCFCEDAPIMNNKCLGSYQEEIRNQYCSRCEKKGD